MVYSLMTNQGDYMYKDLNDIDEINNFGIIPDDGIADGGEPYTDDEMELIYQEYLNKDKN